MVAPRSVDSHRPPPETLEWVIGALGHNARIARMKAMGRGSTAMHALDVLDAAGRVHRLALRRFVDAERLGTDPWYVPRHEADVLQLLDGAEVPAPRLVAADVDAEVCDAPTLLTTRLPGRSPGAPSDMGSFLAQLAAVLPSIHAVDDRARVLLPLYEPYYDPRELRPPSWSRQPAVWGRVLEAVTGPPPDGTRCFIHRDYHPANTLWARGRLTGVVDWTTGCWGPPGIDLARTRLNLASDYGSEAADRFLALYESLTGGGSAHDPYWDLLDAADSVHDTMSPPRDAGEGSFLRFEEYVASVVARL